MTATLPVPTKVLIALGALLVAALALLVARPLLLGGDDTTSAPPTAVVPTTPAPAAKPAPAQPKIVLLAGLPKPVASKLRRDPVVVVSVYTGTSVGDRASVREAKAGARAAGAQFAKLNVLDEDTARAVQSFAGTMSTPAVLVVKRPGKIVTRLAGPAEDAIVTQAAHNAGARKG
ncbi:MAG: hypothetical protein ACRC50_03420 [Gaiella sp.]